MVVAVEGGGVGCVVVESGGGGGCECEIKLLCKFSP